MSQDDGEGHTLLRLISGIAKHQTLREEHVETSPTVPTGCLQQANHKMNPNLITGSHVLLFSIQVNALSDVRGLLLQSHQDVAGLVVKTCRTSKHTCSQVFQELNLQAFYEATLMYYGTFFNTFRHHN